jgi:hypothetical protein
MPTPSKGIESPGGVGPSQQHAYVIYTTESSACEGPSEPEETEPDDEDDRDRRLRRRTTRPMVKAAHTTRTIMAV